MSAPPQPSPLSSPLKAPIFPNLQRSPPQSKFEPELPPMTSRPPRIPTPSEGIRFSPMEHRSRPSPSPQLTNMVDAYALDSDVAMGLYNEEVPAEIKGHVFGEPNSLDVDAPDRIANHGDQLTRRRPAPPLQESRSRFMRFIYII